jgi:cytochrome c-type protein NapC
MLALRFILLFAVVVASAGRPSAGVAQEIDWEKIPSFNATLFYPGVASWEFLLSDSHRLGGKNIKKGERACIECHFDESTGNLDIGAELIAAGKLTMKRSNQRFEPDPIPGKKGFLKVNVQAAYDDDSFYLRFDWESVGSSWKEPPRAGEDRFDSVAVQVNKSQNTFKRYGCFVACHKFLASMPESPSKKELESHPYYGPLQREDLRLYAFYTREEEGWAGMKKEADLKRLLEEGGLIDLWRVKFSGQKTEAEDWSIFADRLKDKQEDVEGSGRWKEGRYTVILKRKLRTGDAKDVQLAPGDELTVGVAVHDDKVKQRRHYVSFPISIGLGSSTGMIKAVKIK